MVLPLQHLSSGELKRRRDLLAMIADERVHAIQHHDDDDVIAWTRQIDEITEILSGRPLCNPRVELRRTMAGGGGYPDGLYWFVTIEDDHTIRFTEGYLEDDRVARVVARRWLHGCGVELDSVPVKVTLTV